MCAKKEQPVHPGVILDVRYLMPLNLSIEEVAKELKISKKNLHRITVQRDPITPSIAKRLAKLFDPTPEFWLDLQEKYDIWFEKNKDSHCYSLSY